MRITETKKKFAFDVGWVFISSVVVLILHFFQSPIVARYLGPDGLGLLSMTLIIMDIIGLVAGFGIGDALVKYVAEYKKQKDRLYSLVSDAFITMLIIGVITGTTLFVCADIIANMFNMPRLSLLLKISALMFPFSFAGGTLIVFLNGIREMRYYAFLRIFQASLVLAFIIAFLMVGLGVEGAVLGTILAIIITTNVAMVIIRRFVQFKISEYKKNIKMLASFGSRIVGANMISQIYYNIDTLMIGYFLTSIEVGYYSVAISLSRFFWLVPRAMGTVAYPAISEYWAKNDIQAISKLVDKSTKYSACMLIFAGMFVVFFAGDIIAFVFTPEFLPAVLPLAILIIGTVTSGVLRPIGAIFTSVGKVNLTLKISAIGAVGDVLLNIALIPTYGIIGAATATTASYALNVFITIFFLRRALAIKLDTAWFTKMTTLIGTSVMIFYGLDFINHYFSAAIALILYTIIVIKYLLTEEDRDYFVSIIKHTLRGDFMKV